MRIAIGGLMHESNSFNPDPTGLDLFTLSKGAELLKTWGEAAHEVGGFIEGASRYGFEAVPALMATAIPSGPVTGEAFEALVDSLIAAVPSDADGMLLALHGAMFSERSFDADGEVIARLRAAHGPDFPLVVTHDFHANISERAVCESSALVVYKTCPHVDQRDRGLQAAQIIAGRRRLTQALAKPRMLFPIMKHNTSVPPLESIFARARQMERMPAVLSASVAAGYQHADVEECGPSAVVVTDGDAALARSLADELSDMLWATRNDLSVILPGAEEAVRLSILSDACPVVLVDVGDNVGGGSPADSTVLLSELIKQRAPDWAMVIHDPGAVAKCAQAGIGRAVSLFVGTPPVPIDGRVRSIHDGTFVETEVRHGGARYNDQGLSAVVATDNGGLLLLNSKRMPPFSLQQLISVGIEPRQRKIIVVKAAVAFRAAYEPVAARIIEVNTPGITAADPALFNYERVPPDKLRHFR